MAIFTDTDVTKPRRRRRGRAIGWVILVLAVASAIVIGMMPAPYVIEKPGPVFNTTGSTTVDKKSVPVISISSAKTYPTSGTLDMLTVNVDGSPGYPPSWAEIASAWFDPSQAVVPMDEIYAPQETTEQSNKEGAAEMSDSQQEATAAAFSAEHIKYQSVVSVDSTIKGSPAAAFLKAGDVLTTVNGKTFQNTDELHALIVANGTSRPMTLVYSRKGVSKTIQFTPQKTSNGATLGVYITQKFTFPITVKIQLQDVGGPSAGMMFALGIIDKLTPGALNGGQKIAGTGTITAGGTVGAIGGIRQKMYGARDAGARYFLAPASNCGGTDGVRDHIPSGLTVYATSTLAQSIAILKAIDTGVGLNKLKTCG